MKERFNLERSYIKWDQVVHWPDLYQNLNQWKSTINHYIIISDQNEDNDSEDSNNEANDNKDNGNNDNNNWDKDNEDNDNEDNYN